MKSTETLNAPLNKVLPAWKGLRDSVPFFGPIRDERSYTEMQELMDELLDVVGDDESHALADLLDIVGLLIAQYDDQRLVPIKQAKPLEILKFLMDQHGLKQSDLRKEIGTQGVVSEVLSGNRAINARQAKALAKRFRVSPALFL